jgi:TetR/AcrR family transcriptional regulator, transcriptional repressor for nem operon
MARPREFDEQTVLEAATAAFWAKGFEGTSTRDLTACTGLTPSSLYAAFGDKQTLFRRALDHYLGTLHDRMRRFETALPPAQAIAAFFEAVIERSVADKLRRGCMLVNAALEVSPGEVELRAAIARELAMIERFFHGRFLAGQEAGEISRAWSAEDAARHLLSVLIGLRVFARVRPERALLAGAVRPALAVLGLPPLAEPQSQRGKLPGGKLPGARSSRSTRS